MIVNRLHKMIYLTVDRKSSIMRMKKKQLKSLPNSNSNNILEIYDFLSVEDRKCLMDYYDQSHKRRIANNSFWDYRVLRKVNGMICVIDIWLLFVVCVVVSRHF